MWICPFCLSRNGFPPHYKDINNTNLPAELLPKYSTIEYTFQRGSQYPPVFMYVIDTCLEMDELTALKDTIEVSLSLLPPNAIIGLITFGAMTQLHEIGFQECPKAYVFQGSKDIDNKKFQDMLGISGGAGMQQRPTPGQQNSQHPPYGASRFLQPVSQCEYSVCNLIENLLPDPWPTSNDKRPKRCTGVAISVAVNLLEVLD